MSGKHYYTDEKNAQIVIALLKAHGIKRVIASPGSTHMAFLGSAEYDPWFQIWSAVDERHAAYMALGMAAETGEPVVLTCTGSTASRNYLPALTEAFYRKIPILAITGSQFVARRGNLFSQFVDRSAPPRDAIKFSLPCPPVENEREWRECELAVNKAILELFRHGGGPVHINLETFYDRGFRTRELPAVRKLTRYFVGDEFPELPSTGKIAVFIATHKPFSSRLQNALNGFLKSHDAVALCQATSSWTGDKRFFGGLVCAQRINQNPAYAGLKPNLIIMIGEACNDYSLHDYLYGLAPTWYVSEDGEACDRLGMLENVFEMPEEHFFEHYQGGCGSDGYYKLWREADDRLRDRLPKLPFSNLWIAHETMPRLGEKDVLHIGLSMSLQSWSAFLVNCKARVCCNAATCGIDGCVSTLIGASLANEKKLYFGVVGDLTFFYDMNSLGNRHIGKNLRLLLVNNGCGGLFHAPGHIQEKFTDVLDNYMAAGGHFGRKSHELVKHYATDLGFKYLSASSKEEFAACLDEFLSDVSDRPILFECFVDIAADRDAWGARTSIDPPPTSLKGEIKKMVPQRVKNIIKEMIR